MESYSTRLNALSKGYADGSDAWRLFIQDHKQLILENSVLVTISKSTIHTYKYRIEEYLKSIGHPITLAWIVLYINNIKSNLEFKDLDSLYIPTESYIESLYQLFSNSEQQYLYS